MYTYNTKVGFSQVDTDKLMKMEALTAAFQDVTCFQVEVMGVGCDYLVPKVLAWILNSWQIGKDASGKGRRGIYSEVCVGRTFSNGLFRTEDFTTGNGRVDGYQKRAD